MAPALLARRTRRERRIEHRVAPARARPEVPVVQPRPQVRVPERERADHRPRGRVAWREQPCGEQAGGLPERVRHLRSGG